MYKITKRIMSAIPALALILAVGSAAALYGINDLVDGLSAFREGE
jgi:hypothetical protein